MKGLLVHVEILGDSFNIRVDRHQNLWNDAVPSGQGRNDVLPGDAGGRIVKASGQKHCYLKDCQGKNRLALMDWGQTPMGVKKTAYIANTSGTLDKANEGTWELLEVPVDQNANQVWGGIAFKGAVSAVAGVDEALCVLWNMNDIYQWMPLVVQNARFGLVAGAGAGFGVVIATGFYSRKDFLAYDSSSWDFEFDLGPGWDEIVKKAGKAETLGKYLLEAVKETDPAKLTKLGEKISSGLGSLMTLVKGGINYARLDWTDQGINIFDVFGWGLQVGVFCTRTTCAVAPEWFQKKISVIEAAAKGELVTAGGVSNGAGRAK